MTELPWYERPLDRRAHKGGEEGVDGLEYVGGEFLPFYIPRRLMPQIDQVDQGALVRFARQQGVWVRRCVLKSTKLRHHQRVRFDRKLWVPGTEKIPILAALDYFIIDGNHRACANRMLKLESHIIQFGLNFEDAVALVFRFPNTTTSLTE